MSRLTLNSRRLSGARLTNAPLTSAATDLLKTSRTNPNGPAFTILAQSGKVHINNISSDPKGISYSIMAIDEEGKTMMIHRHIALRPYQSVQDDADGYYAMAAFTKN